MGPHGTWLSRSAKVIWFVSIGPRPFVANSEIAEVAVKSPHLIFVVGKKPGVTTLYAVDQNETCWRAKLAVNYLAFFKLAFDPPLASHL